MRSSFHYVYVYVYIFATKAYIEIGKKILKQQYLPHMSSQYGELRPTSG